MNMDAGTVSSTIRPLVVILVGVTSCIAGCGKQSGIRTAPVSGTITYKGQPVEGATVSFIPDGAERPATAISTAGGKYELATLDLDGAMPGKYTVLVRKAEVAAASTEPVSMEEALKLNSRPATAPKDLVPAKYGDPSRSPLKFEVKTGQKNVFDIQLTD